MSLANYHHALNLPFLVFQAIQDMPCVKGLVVSSQGGKMANISQLVGNIVNFQRKLSSQSRIEREREREKQHVESWTVSNT